MEMEHHKKKLCFMQAEMKISNILEATKYMGLVPSYYQRKKDKPKLRRYKIREVKYERSSQKNRRQSAGTDFGQH